MAIAAIGLAGAMEMTLSAADGAAVISCKPLTYLLHAASWSNRRMRFNVEKISKDIYLSLSAIDPRILHRLEESRTFPKWWTWRNEGPSEGLGCPGWWINTSIDVVSLPV